MKINNHEIKFLRTVLANCEIAKVCENRDIQNFDKLIESNDTVMAYHAQCVFICAMQKGYEMHEKFENPDYIPHYITEDDLMLLDPEDFNTLATEAFNAFAGDAVQEIETQEPKAKKNSEASEKTKSN